MCATRAIVHHMPRMIQVRNVPDAVHRTIKARAAAAGKSRSDYIRRDLELAAARPWLEEIDARLVARGPSGPRTQTVLGALRDVRER